MGIGSLPYLVRPITQQIISQCVIRLTNIGLQQSRVAMKQFKQHRSPPPFLTPCSFMYTEPVHTAFRLNPRTLPQRRSITVGRDKNGKNTIHQLNLSAECVLAQSERIKDTCQHVQYFTLSRTFSLSYPSVLTCKALASYPYRDPSRNCVSSSTGVNTLRQAKQIGILCNYHPVLQPGPSNKSTKIYT